VKKPNEPNIPPTPSLHVQKVLELCPGIVQTVDKDKRLPLHYAAASATASFDVFITIFEANKDAASIRDPVTGLFPFQLAACHHNYAASFSLLLANPNLVSSAVTGASDVSDRKRKRSS
jgi:DNA/RNA endonuclease G (NUC1)